jgi:hypothetical protein
MLSSSTTAWYSAPQAVTESMIFCGALAAKPLGKCVSTFKYRSMSSLFPKATGTLSCPAMNDYWRTKNG